ncbi:MAG TPA: hypothetical protein VE968_01670 [Sphingomicrobium sp.]|nr:hypothetical protein [Sphingomicrobium sp.]
MNMEKTVRGSSDTSVRERLIAAVDRAELRTSPFDHIYMTNVLDRKSYEMLLDEMPDRSFYHELRHQDALRGDGSSTRLRMYLYPELLRQLPEKQQSAWAPIAEALCSRELELAFKRKFRRSLQERFGKPAEKIGLYPIPILLRDQPGYRIGIHSDVKKKAITVQFYLPPDEAQRHIGTIFHEGKDGEAAKKTTQMPFMPASGYAFPVALTKSWHSAAATNADDGERVSMMVTYYVADSFARRLYWKARRALLSLGLHSNH